MYKPLYEPIIISYNRIATAADVAIVDASLLKPDDNTNHLIGLLATNNSA